MRGARDPESMGPWDAHRRVVPGAVFARKPPAVGMEVRAGTPLASDPRRADAGLVAAARPRGARGTSP